MDSDDEAPALIETEPQNATVRVPLTIITGFLGAGKSTLLKRILTERHGYRIAVIMNEFGDTADIEAKAINVSSAEDPTAEKSEEFLELANGCLCCSIKDAGVAAIEKLMERKGAFDHILLETTGLADPGPIASMLWQNEEYAMGLGNDIALDGVVCVVDAVFGMQQIQEDQAGDDVGESLRQIAGSDVILVNKVDLVTPADLTTLEGVIKGINPIAPVHRTTRSEIDLKHIIGISAFTDPAYLRSTILPTPKLHDHEACDEPHDHPMDPAPTHYELRGISSLQLPCPVLSAARLELLDAWIRTVLWENHIPESQDSSTLQVLRCKGLFFTEAKEQYVLQGVRSLYEMSAVDGVDSDNMGIPDGKIVLIGKGLDGTVSDSLKRILWEGV